MQVETQLKGVAAVLTMKGDSRVRMEEQNALFRNWFERNKKEMSLFAFVMPYFVSVA